MRRAHAIVFVLSLLAAPLTILATVSCCPQPACCAKNYCPLSTKHPPDTHEENELLCHRSSSPASNCAMKSTCNHSVEIGMVSPLPPAVLQGAIGVSTPQASRWTSPLLSSAVPPGFDPLPFKPPRS